MYNNGNDRTNGADEIMRRLMDITGRGMTDDMYNYDMNNGFRSIHGTPEGSEEDDMWSVPTISQQRPQRPPNGNNGNNGNNGQMRPQRPENRPPQRPENRPPMQENRPPQRPENRPPMQENRPPQRPENRPPMQENRPPQRPERPESPKPMQPCGCMRTGYACVKPHDFEGVNEPHRALKRGTLFKILDLPKNVYEMKEED
ncbi:MAG: hypothetical protein IJY55_00715 [Clostridia bacterium]|nr:hypothetical protein [Clostridia bacterium]